MAIHFTNTHIPLGVACDISNEAVVRQSAWSEARFSSMYYT